MNRNNKEFQKINQINGYEMDQDNNTYGDFANSFHLSGAEGYTGFVAGGGYGAVSGYFQVFLQDHLFYPLDPFPERPVECAFMNPHSQLKRWKWK